MPLLFRSAVVLLYFLSICAHAAPVLPKLPDITAQDLRCTADGGIHVEGFATIGGIPQWLTVHGAKCSNPVVLFVHGGPGNPLTPYAANLYRGWERDFTLVHWDQRGAGRTYARNTDTEKTTLSIARMAQDGVEVAAMVAAQLGKKQVVLVGGSWGSALGVHILHARPALFAAYVGTSQMVNHRDNVAASYRIALAKAEAAGDDASLQKLVAMGVPPWSDPRHYGNLRRITRAYEARATEPAPRDWWQVTPAYATPADAAAYEAGDDYSFIQAIGMNGQGMMTKVDLPSLGLDFAMPVYLIHGTEDLVTTPGIARRYFDAIRAPAKEFILLPRTGHDPNQPMLDAVYKVLKERATPRG